MKTKLLKLTTTLLTATLLLSGCSDKPSKKSNTRNITIVDIKPYLNEKGQLETTYLYEITKDTKMVCRNLNSFLKKGDRRSWYDKNNGYYEAYMMPQEKDSGKPYWNWKYHPIDEEIERYGGKDYIRILSESEDLKNPVFFVSWLSSYTVYCEISNPKEEQMVKGWDQNRLMEKYDN